MPKLRTITLFVLLAIGLVIGFNVVEAYLRGGMYYLWQPEHTKGPYNGIDHNFDLDAVLQKAPAVASFSVNDWPGLEYSKVLGIRITDKHSFDQEVVLYGQKINEEAIRRLTVAAVGLDETSLKRVLNACLATDKTYSGWACYEPHHAFVFYSKQNKPVAAIEVCFSCLGLDFLPDKNTRRHTDWAELAKVVDGTGLGLGPWWEKGIKSYFETHPELQNN